MNYLLDTNILIAFIKQNHVADTVTGIFALTDNNQLFISTVTIGEALSIAKRNNWGAKKAQHLTSLVDSFTQLSVNGDALYQLYATLDTFSQNKLIDRPLNESARNMGKNDLWIAAAAALAGATLITTDKDFDHLHDQFLNVIWINPTQSNR